jgi:hypothetical protein
MSDHSHEITPPRAETFDAKHAGNLPNLFVAAGVGGIAVSLIGLVFPAWRTQFAFSWLFGFAYFFTILVGSLFWICLHHATDAQWSVVVRRQLENVSKLLIYIWVFFLPIIFFCKSLLWRWWTLPAGREPGLDLKAGYLNHPFFYVRVVVYFVVLALFGYAFWRRSTNQDKDGAATHTLSMRKWGVAGIFAVALCITFAAVDWLMGLDFHWYSTMWGVYIFAGAAGSSLSLLVLIVGALQAKGYLKIVNEEHYHIMGKFLLAFTIFWAYIGFDQYMLIWYANIPEETSYFVLRNTESWWYLSSMLVWCRFVLPFPVLLFQFIKKNNVIYYVSGWILFMQLVDVYVIVLPVLHRTGVRFSLFDLSAVVGIGGILGWLFFRIIIGSNLFPTRDPRLLASLKLTN